MCKAIIITLCWLSTEIASAQGFLYSQQPACEGLYCPPQARSLVPGPELELYYGPVQEQQQAIREPLPFDPRLPYLTTHQGGQFGQPLMVCPPEGLNGRSAYGSPQTIFNETHIAPQNQNRPVLRFLVRPRRAAQGRTT